MLTDLSYCSFLLCANIKTDVLNSKMPSRRNLTTPQCKGVVPAVTVIDGTVKCSAWIMNNAQLVQVCPIPRAPPERDRQNMSASDTPKKKEEGSDAAEVADKEEE